MQGEAMSGFHSIPEAAAPTKAHAHNTDGGTSTSSHSQHKRVHRAHCPSPPLEDQHKENHGEDSCKSLPWFSRTHFHAHPRSITKRSHKRTHDRDTAMSDLSHSQQRRVHPALRPSHPHSGLQKCEKKKEYRVSVTTTKSKSHPTLPPSTQLFTHPHTQHKGPTRGEREDSQERVSDVSLSPQPAQARARSPLSVTPSPRSMRIGKNEEQIEESRDTDPTLSPTHTTALTERKMTPKGQGTHLQEAVISDAGRHRQP